MEYPREFSQAAIARIEEAKIRARSAFRKSRPYNPLDSLAVSIQEPATSYVMTVVLAFGHEACELGRPRILSIVGELWSLGRIEQETINFLEQYAPRIFEETGAGNIITKDGNIEQRIWMKFMDSDEWQSFEEARLEIAVLLTKPPIIGIAGLGSSSNFGPIGLPKIKSATAREIEKLRAEARMTLDDLVAETKFNKSTISRHESGESTPQPWRITTYERVFSNRLGRQVVIPVTPIKRN